MENELVSILIPVYNRQDIVGETIESAQKQTYKNIEIVIVDNCSTDGTWDKLKEFSKKDDRIRIFKNEENIGPVRNWKRCIEEANGKYSKILFSDDLISENFVEESLALLDDTTAFTLSVCAIIKGEEVFYEKNLKYSKELVYNSKDYLFTTLILDPNERDFPVSPGCALFRTDDLYNALVVDIPNDYDMDFNRYGAGNDLLLFLLTALKYEKVKVVSKATAFFRAHEGSFTVSRNLDDFYFYAKYYFVLNSFPSLLPQIKTRLWIWARRNKKLQGLVGIRDLSAGLLIKLLWRKIAKSNYYTG